MYVYLLRCSLPAASAMVEAAREGAPIPSDKKAEALMLSATNTVGLGFGGWGSSLRVQVFRGPCWLFSTAVYSRLSRVD